MSLTCRVLHSRRWRPHLEADESNWKDWVLTWRCPVCDRIVRSTHVGALMDDAV